MIVLCLCACGQKEAAPTTWQGQYDLGIRYLSEGNYEEAIIAFTVAIEIDPKNKDAYLGLAEVYIAQGESDKAEEILEKGFDITGDERLSARLEEIKSRNNESANNDSEIKAASCFIRTAPNTSVQNVDYKAQSYEWADEKVYEICSSDRNGECISTFSLPIEKDIVEWYYNDDSVWVIAANDDSIVFNVCTGPQSFRVLSYDAHNNTYYEFNGSLDYQEKNGYLIGCSRHLMEDEYWFDHDTIDLGVWSLDGDLVSILSEGKYGVCHTIHDNYIYYSFAEKSYRGSTWSSNETYDDVEQEVWRFNLNTLTSEFLSTVSAGHITEVGQGYVICHDFNGGSELQTVYY